MAQGESDVFITALKGAELCSNLICWLQRNVIAKVNVTACADSRTAWSNLQDQTKCPSWNQKFLGDSVGRCHPINAPCCLNDTQDGNTCSSLATSLHPHQGWQKEWVTENQIQTEKLTTYCFLLPTSPSTFCKTMPSNRSPWHVMTTENFFPLYPRCQACPAACLLLIRNWISDQIKPKKWSQIWLISAVFRPLLYVALYAIPNEQWKSQMCWISFGTCKCGRGQLLSYDREVQGTYNDTWLVVILVSLSLMDWLISAVTGSPGCFYRNHREEGHCGNNTHSEPIKSQMHLGKWSTIPQDGRFSLVVELMKRDIWATNLPYGEILTVINCGQQSFHSWYDRLVPQNLSYSHSQWESY